MTVSSPRFVPQDDGTGVLDCDQARTALFGDCDPERTAEGVAQLGRMNLAVPTQAVTAAAWTELPATYVRGTQDLLVAWLAPGFLDWVSEVVALPHRPLPPLEPT